MRGLPRPPPGLSLDCLLLDHLTDTQVLGQVVFGGFSRSSVPTLPGPCVSYNIRSAGIWAGTKAHPDSAAILHDPLDGPSERFPSVGIRSAYTSTSLDRTIPQNSAAVLQMSNRSEYPFTIAQGPPRSRSSRALSSPVGSPRSSPWRSRLRSLDHHDLCLP